MQARILPIVSFAAVWLGACGDSQGPAPQVRPVRTVTVQQRTVSEPVVLTGQIKAQDEISLAFRIDGKVIERNVSVGEKITSGHLVARLDPQNEQNALRSAEADVTAARATLLQAEKAEGRQRELLSRGNTTRVLYDQSLQQMQTATAQVDSAVARFETAQRRVKDTELFTEVMGTITAKGAEPGEIVRGGQMIARISREDRLDAVFDVPVQLMQLKGVPQNPTVDIALAENPNARAMGRVREVPPQPDPATRTFAVKVALIDPPPEMHLGATVTGGISLTSPPVMTVPATALIEADGKPSVWVVNPRDSTVALRPVQIVRYDPSLVIIADGLRDGEVVVTAGVHILHPGQKVKLLPGAS